MSDLTDGRSSVPGVGDKVVYCGPRNDWEWPDRKEQPGQVVQVDQETASVLVFTPSEGEWWLAPASEVTVVERATYTPAGADRRDAVIAAAEELTEALRVVAGLTDRSVDPASVSDHAGDVDGAVREYEARAADALTRLGYGSRP